VEMASYSPQTVRRGEDILVSDESAATDWCAVACD
jgi:hypothetical protein